MSMPRPRKDFTGMRFAKLVAIRPTGKTTGSRNAIWELRCDCGNVRLADSGKLTAGKAKSCGCILKTQFACSAEGCKEPARCMSLCNRHYKRSKIEMRTSYNVAERFSLKTLRAENGCLEWIGAASKEGYGQTTVKRKRYNTHKLAWELAFGPVPSGIVVCHRCDNPRCVDVSHLFLGTQKDNIRDAMAKGRMSWQRKCT